MSRVWGGDGGRGELRGWGSGWGFGAGAVLEIDLMRSGGQERPKMASS